MQAKPVKEAAILSCNRTELYFATSLAPAHAADWFAEYRRVALRELSPTCTLFPQRDAVRRVPCGQRARLPMVIGGPQILGGEEDAVRHAEEAGTLGTTLHKLFQRTFSMAKEVHHRPSAPTSCVAAAAGMSASSSVADQRVLFIKGPADDRVVRRPFGGENTGYSITSRAQPAGQPRVSAPTCCASTRWAKPRPLRHVILDAGSPLPIISLGMVERALKAAGIIRW